MNTNQCNRWEHRLSRRLWLEGVLAAGAAGLGLTGPVVGAGTQAVTPKGVEHKQNRKQVLFVWLDGGLSQLESWDPKPNTQFGGPFRAIPTSLAGLHISEL